MQDNVETYLPTVIDWIEQDIEALNICTSLGLCSTTIRSKFSGRKATTGCEVCKVWFQWAENKLENVTVEALWKLVSEECPKVPYLQYFCQTINEHFVSLILSNLQPKQCCSWVSL